MNTIRLHEHLPLLPGRRTLAVIDPAALAENYRLLMARVRAASPATEGIAVVKADAYGHGIRPAVAAFLGAGCRAFAVACPEEAVALRRLLREAHADIEPSPLILVLGYTPPEDAAILSAYDITTALVSDAYATALSAEAERAGVTVRVHAALDTGMNRIGYPAHTDGEIAETAAALLRRFGPGGCEQSLCLDGLFTHFARADEDPDTEMSEGGHTLTQYARYRRVLDALVAGGLRPRLCHVCNSAAAVRFPGALPEGCLDAVRLGISLYGYGVPAPDGDTRPALRLITAVSHVHDLLPGEAVGYGGTFEAATLRRIATLPVGYADGFLRAYAGAEVTLHTPVGDHRAPLVGRICMDQCMVDITALPEGRVTPGTPVTLFGATRADLKALAARAHTIPYELLSLITARVPRIYEEDSSL